ncbi:redox-regulated ATPase YchF, partial [Arthrospira platensis SPKY1]|nr:redox-regulated ATPase YchF [Arthrospira platensis SPKY1]
DIETVEKRLDRVKRQAKSGQKDDLKQVAIAEQVLAHLSDGKPARTLQLDEAEQEVLAEMFLLTAKPILYVCNVDEESVKTGNAHTEAFLKAIADEPAEAILISVGI